MCWRRTRGTASWNTSSRWGLYREGKVKLDTLCWGAVLSKGLFYQVVQYYIPQSGGGSIQEEDEDLAVTESEVRLQYSCVIFMAMVAIMKLLLSTRWPIQILGAGHWSLMWAWPTGELEEEGKSTVLNSCISGTAGTLMTRRLPSIWLTHISRRRGRWPAQWWGAATRRPL